MDSNNLLVADILIYCVTSELRSILKCCGLTKSQVGSKHHISINLWLGVSVQELPFLHLCDVSITAILTFLSNYFY